MEINKMLEFKIVKEKEIEGKLIPFQFCFSMPDGAPIGMSYDALYEMMGKVVESAQVAFERMKAKKEEDQKQEAEKDKKD